MGSSVHNRGHGNMLSLISRKMLNFGRKAFLILFFLNITTKLISDFKNYIFVMSSLSTLWDRII